jgi:hypothetical protein
MKLSPHYLKRYKDITLLLLKYRQQGTISKFGLEDAAAISNGCSG